MHGRSFLPPSATIAPMTAPSRDLTDAFKAPEYRVEGELKVTGRARPKLRIIHVPTPIGPDDGNGAKSVGETANNAAAAAINNAVTAATGVRLTHIPLFAEVVLATLTYE